MERNEKILRHILSITEELLTYCDRDEPLQKEVIEEGLNGIKNVIKLELKEERKE